MSNNIKPKVKIKIKIKIKQKIKLKIKAKIKAKIKQNKNKSIKHQNNYSRITEQSMKISIVNMSQRTLK